MPAAKVDLAASLLNGLDPVLSKMDPLYRYFLTDAQKALDQNGQFTAQTAKVRSLTANTSDMVTAFHGMDCHRQSKGLISAQRSKSSCSTCPISGPYLPNAHVSHRFQPGLRRGHRLLQCG